MSLREYVDFLERYALFLLVITLTGMGITLYALFFVVRPTYLAETSVLLLKQQPAGVGALLNQLEGSLDMLGSLQNLGIEANRSLKEDMLSVLKSRQLALEVSEVVPLESLPELQEELTLSPRQENRFSEAERLRFREQVIYEFLQEQVTVLPPGTRNHTLRVQAEVSSPALSVQLAEAYVSRLRAFMEKVLNADENQQLAYLKNQRDTLKKELAAAENDLLVFQQRYDTVSLDDEVKQRIKALAELEAEVITADAAYKETLARQQTLRNSSAELAPESASQRNALEMELAGLKQRKLSLQREQQRYTNRLKKLPQQGLTLARLQRQVTLKNQLYLLLQQQTTAAELDQQRQFKLFRVLDHAVVPLEPHRPVKPLWLGVSTVLSFAAGLGLALFHKTYRDLKSHKKAPSSPVVNA